MAVEQLDHRRLLSVNFTGNVATDFPATESPGVVIFNSSNTPRPDHVAHHPVAVLKSHQDLGLRHLGNPRVVRRRDDTLSVGLNQPPADPSNPSSGSVIAGDADDNGNAGNVNPAVLALDPLFTEFPALEGEDIQMAAFLDLRPDAGRARHRRRILANPAPAPTQHVALALTQSLGAETL